jgi:hypothetical protein
METDQRTIMLAHEDAFLSAEPDGERVVLVKPATSGLQTFLRLSATDRETLKTLLTCAWLIRSSGSLSERPALGQLFHLLVGELEADLRFQSPFDIVTWPDRLTLLRDGWRIDQICLYRPLIYYSVFGEAHYLEQFAISLRSLIEFGLYQDSIVILTDHPPQSLARFVPADDIGRIAVLPVGPSDRAGFMAARYFILDWPDAALFQLLLYVDTDTVFDRDVTPMLQAIATSDRIAAPLEMLSALSTSPASGAALLQRDLCSPGFLASFNTGTLGIPNLRAHGSS